MISSDCGYGGTGRRGGLPDGLEMGREEVATRKGVRVRPPVAAPYFRQIPAASSPWKTTLPPQRALPAGTYSCSRFRFASALSSQSLGLK
jgi:hypothetical protein